MSNDPWYHALLGVDFRQARDIHRVAHSADKLETRLELLERENDRLWEMVQRVDTVLQVLGAHLVSRGVVDGAKISEELRRALAPAQPSAAPPQPVVPSGSAYRGEVPRQPEVVKIACAGCAEQVPQASTQFTEHGALCERCFQAAELERLTKLESGEG